MTNLSKTRKDNNSNSSIFKGLKEKPNGIKESLIRSVEDDNKTTYYVVLQIEVREDYQPQFILDESGKTWKDKDGTPWAMVFNVSVGNAIYALAQICKAAIPTDEQKKWFIQVEFEKEGDNIKTPSADSPKTKNSENSEENFSVIGKYIEGNRQVIFTGAPGTGKTFGIRQHIKQVTGKLMVDGEEIKQSEFVQFHSSYDYSDFVEGLRPVQVVDRQTQKKEVMFVRMDGIFKRFCRNIVEYNLQVLNSSRDVNHRKFLTDRSIEALMEACDLGEDATDAQQEKKKAIVAKINETKFYFVIDEINRADLGKVFGELMFGLEEAYRGVENRFATQYANLPTYYVDPAHPEKNGFYQMMQAKGKNKTKQTKQTEQAEQVEQTAQTNQDCISKEDVFARGFFIPENLYIVGSMNDIDRSVESFDFALRRRFKWVDIKANDCMSEVLSSMYQQGATKLTDPKELDPLVARAKALNDVIWCKQGEGDAKKTGGQDVNLGAQFGLNEAFHIGPAYFKDYNPTDVDETWTSRIEPILREYVRGRDAKKVENFIKACKKAYTKADSDTNTEDQSDDKEKLPDKEQEHEGGDEA